MHEKTHTQGTGRWREGNQWQKEMGGGGGGRRGGEGERGEKKGEDYTRSFGENENTFIEKCNFGTIFSSTMRIR